MHRTALMAAWFLVGSAWAAEAATVVYYSDPGEHFGWAAGYSSSRAHRVAESYCRNAGGTECRVALQCAAGGAGAVAFADATARGVGIACGFRRVEDARLMALATCMGTAGALCRTEAAFTGSGRAASQADNEAFDRTLFAQQMLFQLEHLAQGQVDGVYGPRTREAIRAFQARLGLEQDGAISPFLVQRLLNATGGSRGFALAMYEGIVVRAFDEVGDRVYGHASAPVPWRSYSEELAAYSVSEQRLALATILRRVDLPCTLPARQAAPFPEDGSGIWRVECDEANYTVTVGPQSVTAIRDLTEEGASAGPNEMHREPTMQTESTSGSLGRARVR